MRNAPLSVLRTKFKVKLSLRKHLKSGDPLSEFSLRCPVGVIVWPTLAKLLAVVITKFHANQAQFQARKYTSGKTTRKENKTMLNKIRLELNRIEVMLKLTSVVLCLQH